MNDFYNRMRAVLRRHTSHTTPSHPSAQKDISAMSNLLTHIETALQTHYPDIYASLTPGANEAELQRLKAACFDGADIPEDLIALYTWHNGQAGNGSLNPEDNRTFIAIDEVISSWEFLNDPMEDIYGPISKDWIPITYNGAGDHLMYVARGEHAGALIGYWHDDVDRDVEYSSLTAWLEAILTAAQTPPKP